MAVAASWEGTASEYGTDGVVLDTDDASSSVAGAAPVWLMIATCYSTAPVANFYGEIDVWNDAWTAVAMSVGKCYANSVTGSDVLDAGVVYFEAKYWWGNNRVVDD